MSEAAVEEKGNFLVLDKRISGWLFIISSWGILLWLLNILHMATPTGDKVVWASILSIGLVGGDYITTNPDFRLYSDGIFILLCLSFNALAIRGIMSNVEGGIKGWMLSVGNNFWPAIVDFSNVRKIISVWLIILGLAFYLVAGIFYGGWVDPGVYSVTAPCVIFGWAFGKLADIQSLED